MSVHEREGIGATLLRVLAGGCRRSERERKGCFLERKRRTDTTTRKEARVKGWEGQEGGDE